MPDQTEHQVNSASIRTWDDSEVEWVFGPDLNFPAWTLSQPPQIPEPPPEVSPSVTVGRSRIQEAFDRFQESLSQFGDLVEDVVLGLLERISPLEGQSSSMEDFSPTTFAALNQENPARPGDTLELVFTETHVYGDLPFDLLFTCVISQEVVEGEELEEITDGLIRGIEMMREQLYRQFVEHRQGPGSFGLLAAEADSEIGRMVVKLRLEPQETALGEIQFSDRYSGERWDSPSFSNQRINVWPSDGIFRESPPPREAQDAWNAWTTPDPSFHYYANDPAQYPHGVDGGTPMTLAELLSADERMDEMDKLLDRENGI